jgi:hypothetical protein
MAESLGDGSSLVPVYGGFPSGQFKTVTSLDTEAPVNLDGHHPGPGSQPWAPQARGLILGALSHLGLGVCTLTP